MTIQKAKKAGAASEAVDIMNLNRIHPLNRKKVERGASEMARLPGVDQIFIFGSSVSERCHVGSDVDVYVKCRRPMRGELIRATFSHPFDEYDVWTNFDVDGNLLAEIKKHCVLVYERKEG